MTNDEIIQGVITLDNYDGNKAYNDLVEYTVFTSSDLKGAVFATPSGSELDGMEALLDNETMDKKYPLLKIINDKHGFQQALARKATENEKQTVYAEFERLAQDLGMNGE